MATRHLVIVQVIERGDDGDDPGVLAIHTFDALEGVWRVVLHEGQVKSRLKPPRSCSIVCSRPLCIVRLQSRH